VADAGATSVVILMQTDAGRRRLQPLAAAGRMALSNDSVVIWGAQPGAGVLWLWRFRYG